MIARPHFEARPYLAAHGLVPGPPAPLVHPFIQALTRSPAMADIADYALIERLDAVTKPTVFGTVARLAVHIEGLRKGRPLELADVEDIEIPGLPGLYVGVQIWTLDMSNGRDVCLGWAWLKGQGRDRLEPALRAVRRDIGRNARKAVA